jgi:photosystem II stability/assembly factor-like uncharacterized protein
MSTSVQVAHLPDPGHADPFPTERHAHRWGLRRRHRSLLLAVGAAWTMACNPGGVAPQAASPLLVPQQSGTTQLLQAVSVVDERVIWVSGHGGTWARSRDGGTTWESGVVPGQDSLQFRDVHAVHADTALLLAAGPGERSRIFRTQDGGGTWTEVWRNLDPEGFFDCLDLWDPVGSAPRRGLAFSDAVEGHFTVLLTEDAGLSWSALPAESLPPALDGEGGFAASGTCLVVVGDRHGWIGTGAGVAPRVLRTSDGGTTWQAAPSPLPAGEAAGIASLVFQDTLVGWAFGGNLGDPASRTDNVAVTTDGGATWTSGAPSRMPGAIYGAALAPGSDPAVLITVGPGGADLTLDGGGSWMALDSLSSWAVGFSSPSTAWLVGPAGRITRVDLNLEGR